MHTRGVWVGMYVCMGMDYQPTYTIRCSEFTGKKSTGARSLKKTKTQRDFYELARQVSFDRQLPGTSEAVNPCQQSQRQLVSVMAQS